MSLSAEEALKLKQQEDIKARTDDSNKAKWKAIVQYGDKQRKEKGYFSLKPVEKEPAIKAKATHT